MHIHFSIIIHNTRKQISSEPTDSQTPIYTTFKFTPCQFSINIIYPVLSRQHYATSYCKQPKCKLQRCQNIHLQPVIQKAHQQQHICRMYTSIPDFIYSFNQKKHLEIKYTDTLLSQWQEWGYNSSSFKQNPIEGNILVNVVLLCTIISCKCLSSITSPLFSFFRPSLTN